MVASSTALPPGSLASVLEHVLAGWVNRWCGMASSVSTMAGLDEVESR
jgi:hypothetical protein